MWGGLIGGKDTDEEDEDDDDDDDDDDIDDDGDGHLQVGSAVSAGRDGVCGVVSCGED